MARAPASRAGLVVMTTAREELGAPDATVVATGGLAELISPHSSVIEHVDPFLTLEGLRQIGRAHV